MNNFDIWLSTLYIQPNIKYLIKKLLLYNYNTIQNKCVYIFNLYLNNQSLIKINNLMVHYNEIYKLIYLLIIINKIINYVDTDYSVISIYEILNIAIIKREIITNELCCNIIYELLLDKVIFYNNLYIDIINNTYIYYKLWLSNYNDDNSINNEEYKNYTIIYNEHIKELVYKLNHCFNILINRLHFLI